MILGEAFGASAPSFTDTQVNEQTNPFYTPTLFLSPLLYTSNPESSTMRAHHSLLPSIPSPTADNLPQLHHSNWQVIILQLY